MNFTSDQVDIYLSLDELLDTRGGTLDLMNPELAEKILLDPAYRHRTSDHHEGIDHHDFRKRYGARDNETLVRSGMTAMPQLLKQLAATAQVQMEERPYYKECKIVVNCHPYVLSPEVKEDIRIALAINIGRALPIVMVDYPISALTPSRCKQEFGVMIMYNPQDWLNTHMPALERGPMPEVLLLTPQIHHMVNPTKEQMEQLKAQGAAPFLALEMMARPLVSLDVIETGFFSLIHHAA